MAKADEHLEAITDRIREAAAMEEDARKWREYQEAKRTTDIIAANELVARCKALRDTVAAQLEVATELLTAAETRRDALENTKEII